MKKFKPPISSYPTDDLIFITELSPEEWQKEFVEAAKIELSNRGLNETEVKEKSIEINKNFQAFLEKERKQRAEVSYTTFEAIYRIIFWYRFIFWDWGLKKEGYAKLAKQRIQYLIIGILGYSLFMSWVFFKVDTVGHEREDRIAQGMKVDSVYRSQVDWTGQYQFIDGNIASQKSWILLLEKYDDTKHKGQLEIIRKGTKNLYRIEAVCTDSTVQVFPTEIGQIDSFEISSKYNLLFELVVEDNDTLTWWKKIKPLNPELSNGEEYFKKL